MHPPELLARENPYRLFNHRPLVDAALGLSLGVLVGAKVDTVYALWALYAFGLLCAAAVLFGQRRFLLFGVPLVLGVLRALYIPDAGLFPRASEAFLPVRELLSSRAKALFGQSAPLLSAMLFGDKSALAKADKAIFRSAGLSHVLALSGLHVSFFIAPLSFLLRRAKPGVRFCAIAAFLFCYCAIAAFPVSLVRASVMALCYLGADVFNRRQDTLSALALSALIILSFSPSQLFSLGFQLSFCAVGGIALMGKSLERRLGALPGARALSVTLSATLGTLPLSLYTFGVIPLYTLLANLLLLPLLPAALISGLAAVLLSFLWHPLAELPAFLSRAGISVFSSAAAWVSRLPFSTVDVSISATFACLCYCLFILLSPYLLRDRKFKLAAACILLALMLADAIYGILIV